MGKREERQEIIREYVRRNAVRTQQEISDFLETQGFECTQATVSRDISEIGLRKGRNKCYSVPEDLRLQRLFAELVVSVCSAGNDVVIRTAGGAAAGVAGALDKANYPGILGSVAGDDTIIVITQDEATATKLVNEMEHFCS